MYCKDAAPHPVRGVWGAPYGFGGSFHQETAFLLKFLCLLTAVGTGAGLWSDQNVWFIKSTPVSTHLTSLTSASPSPSHLVASFSSLPSPSVSTRQLSDKQREKDKNSSADHSHDKSSVPSSGSLAAEIENQLGVSSMQISNANAPQNAQQPNAAPGIIAVICLQHSTHLWVSWFII